MKFRIVLESKKQNMKLLFILLSPFALLLFGVSVQAQSNFIYINNNLGANSVAAFSVAPNGALTQIAGSPFATGGFGGGFFYATNRAAICLMKNRLYISNDGSANISGFNINTTTGALKLIPGSPFATGGFTGSGTSIACTPDGKFLITAKTGSFNITVFSIDNNGALTRLGGLSVPAGGQPVGIKISPDGRFLALALGLNNTMAMFNIASNGGLTPVSGSPFPAPGGDVGGGVTGVEINCASNLLFGSISDSNFTRILVYTIGPNGTLALIPGSPFIFDSGDNSNVGILSPNEQFFFVSNQYSNTITVFNVAADGSLTLVPGWPVANQGGFEPQQMVTDREGTLLYVNNSNGTFSIFSINGDGT